MSELALVSAMDMIMAAEKAMLNDPRQIQLEAEHYQIKGVYVRSLFIPAGTLLTGKIHNTEYISILAQGTIKITNGTDSHEITAPKIFVCEAGTKNMGYAVDDVTFINVFRTDKETIEDIEDEVGSDTFEEFTIKLLERG